MNDGGAVAFGSDTDPTLDGCLQLWHRGLALEGGESVFLVCEEAKLNCADNSEHLWVWLESVRRMRAAGLFDADMSSYLLYSIACESVAWEAETWDFPYGDLLDEITELARAHGVSHPDEFAGMENPPAEWTRLERCCEERRFEMLCERLGDAGEADMVRELRTAPAEVWARMAAVRTTVTAGFR